MVFFTCNASKIDLFALKVKEKYQSFKTVYNFCLNQKDGIAFEFIAKNHDTNGINFHGDSFSRVSRFLATFAKSNSSQKF